MTSQNKKKKTFGGTIKLMPIGKDGKEVDWFHGWPGIIKYAEALGKSWTDVGQLIEDTWGDRVSFYQIITCSEVYKSLKNVQSGVYRNKKRIKMAPKGEEPDLHFAIRMNSKVITAAYERSGGKAKDIYKAVSQLYNKTMSSNRKPFVISAARDPKKIK